MKIVLFFLLVGSLVHVMAAENQDIQTEAQENDPEEFQEDDQSEAQENDPEELQEDGQSEAQKNDPEKFQEDDQSEAQENDPEELQEDGQSEAQENDPEEFQEQDELHESVERKTIADIPELTEEMLAETINEAKKETLEEEEKRRPRVEQHGGEPETLQKAHYRRFVPELEPVRISAMVKERTFKKLAQKLGTSLRALEGLDSRSLKDICKPKAKAPGRVKVLAGYRSIDGLGNNVEHPYRGSANAPFTRLLKPDYGDGMSSPRKAADGQDLPNARKVSSFLFKQKSRNSNKLAHMAMIWGQFIDHDITLSVEPDIDCSKTCLSGECFGIPVQGGDRPFKGRSCIEMRRSVPICGPPKREQINIISSFIDGSGVYSSDPSRFNSLRDPKDRALLIEIKNPTRGLKNLLSVDNKGFCRIRQANLKCFKAGDDRVNENSGLASMHTIWNREHNRIVKHLRKLYRHWRPDKVFFEARKIVGAMIQHITYNEFLPAILNYKTRKRFGLVLKKRGFYRGYRKWVNPNIINSFNAAAFRFGHSMVQNRFNRFGKYYKRKITPSIPMSRFFDTSFLYQSRKGGVDSILRGLVKDRSQKVDGFFSKAVQEQLVRSQGDLADLPALNIQRGRDRGVPGYNQFRPLAGLEIAKHFNDLKDVMTWAQIRKLKKIYTHVNDIDLFVGGMYEKPLRGGALGATFSTIVARQFRSLRAGDRFWYENPGQFTWRRLKEIRKTTLARVICDNSDGIRWIYKFVIKGRSPTLCYRLKSYYWRGF